MKINLCAEVLYGWEVPCRGRLCSAGLHPGQIQFQNSLDGLLHFVAAAGMPCKMSLRIVLPLGMVCLRRCCKDRGQVTSVWSSMAPLVSAASMKTATVADTYRRVKVSMSQLDGEMLGVQESGQVGETF